MPLQSLSSRGQCHTSWRCLPLCPRPLAACAARVSPDVGGQFKLLRVHFGVLAGEVGDDPLRCRARQRGERRRWRHGRGGLVRTGPDPASALPLPQRPRMRASRRCTRPRHTPCTLPTALGPWPASGANAHHVVDAGARGSNAACSAMHAHAQTSLVQVTHGWHVHTRSKGCGARWACMHGMLSLAGAQIADARVPCPRYTPSPRQRPPLLP